MLTKKNITQLDFAKGDGLLPVVVQDAKTRSVLMLGYVNEAALLQTVQSQKVTFYSRSKQRLWTKGESSGNFLHLVDLQVDCDQDTLLALVNPAGPTCHQGTETCFGTPNEGDFVSKLESVIQDRRDNPNEQSYTASLFRKGINKVAQKVGEEAVELVIEAKDNDKDLFLNEAADLLYHYLVLLAAKNYSWAEVLDILKSRQK